MRKINLSHPVVQWLIYATCSVVIAGSIAFWLEARSFEPLPEEAHSGSGSESILEEESSRSSQGAPATEPEAPEESEEGRGREELEERGKLEEPLEPSGPIDPNEVFPETAEEALEELSQRDLVLPVRGVPAEDLYDSFDDARSGGRRHKAIDILAPRGTPVLAVDTARVVNISSSPRGGKSLYLIDSTETFCYFYAHLDGYAKGLKTGDLVEASQVLGYVGTTGNAPEDTPHLHLSIHLLGDSRRCLKGLAINPYEIWASGS